MDNASKQTVGLSIEDIVARLDRIEAMLGKIAYLHSSESISIEEHSRAMAAAIKAGDKAKIKQLQQRQWDSAKKVTA